MDNQSSRYGDICPGPVETVFLGQDEEHAIFYEKRRDEMPINFINRRMFADKRIDFVILDRMQSNISCLRPIGDGQAIHQKKKDKGFHSMISIAK